MINQFRVLRQSDDETAISECLTAIGPFRR
jgi:hypothetical protein